MSLVLLAVLVSLIFQGYTRHSVGRAASYDHDPSARIGLGAAGPIVDLGGARVRSVSPRPGQVALTFDDGPDPRWTPRVLAVLRRYHVPATFFVLGSQVLQHPGLVRQELAAGADVGSHTFAHVDLGQDSALRSSLELSLTQATLAGAAGINTDLLRLPYSSVTSAVTVDQYRAARNAAGYGYLTVFATQDTKDWSRPGIGRIVGLALPPGREGGVIMMHDGGGNRAQTVQALQRIIPILLARGDHFVSVSAMAGIRHNQADFPVQRAVRAQGITLFWIFRVSSDLITAITWLMLPFILLTSLRSVLAVFLARRHLKLPRTRPEPWGERHDLPGVSVIVPAYNEEVGIAGTIESLEASEYPELEIVVVDDGSTDRTAEVVRELRAPRTRLITQANAGKPAALNRGIAAARHDLLVLVDGDTVFQPDTVGNLVGPLLTDPAVGAVSGNTKVGNRRSLLGLWQHCEYVIGFNLDRRMCDVLRCIPTIPGAVGGFRRAAIEAAGGVSEDTLAEDTDLTMVIQRRGWGVVYQDDAIAWTEAPSDLNSLWRQRYRWAYGTLQAMWKNRGAVLENSALGRLGLPYLFFFQLLLPLLSPLIDVFALYGVLFLDPWPIVAFWGAFNVIQIVLGIFAFRIDNERLAPLWTLPLQQILYRQLMYLVVVASVSSAFTGARLRWHKLPRSGMDALPT